MKGIFLSSLRVFTNSRFLRSSLIVFLGSTIVNLLNYLFTLVVGRLLGPALFGEVAALSGVFMILSVPASTITTFMAKQSARYKGGQNLASVRHLVAFLDTWASLFGAALLVIFLLFLPFISHLLSISPPTLAIFAFLIPLGFVSAVSTGALQGLQSFRFLQYQNILSALVKLLAAVIFVRAGFSVPGVVVALILSVVASLVYGFFKTVKVAGRMRFFSAEGESDVQWKSLQKYFSVVFANALLLALLSNIDVVMAKHFLSVTDAGLYGALSVTGKIILYGVGAFTTVLLPLVSEAHSQGNENGRKALWLSAAIVSCGGLIGISLFKLAPNLVIKILFGAAYGAIAPYLGVFGLAMCFVALITIFVNYFIATHNHAFIWVFAAAVGVEVLGIAIYHGSLKQVVRIVVGSTGLLAAAMLGVYFLSAPKNSLK